MNQERDERDEQHLQMLREHLIANSREDIAEYQEKRDEAVAQGRESARVMYEDWLAHSRARLAWAEAQQRAT